MKASRFVATLPVVAGESSIGAAFEAMRSADAVAVVTPVLGGYQLHQARDMLEAVSGGPDARRRMQSATLGDLAGLPMGRVDLEVGLEARAPALDARRVGSIFQGHSSMLLVGSTFELEGRLMALALGDPMGAIEFVRRDFVCPVGGERRSGEGYCDDHQVHFVATT